MRSLMAALAVSLVLAGCSDPKAATKGNFKAAIDKWGEQNPSCFYVPAGDVKPASGADAPHPSYLDVKENGPDRQQLDALVQAGVMTVAETTIQANPGWGFTDNTPHDQPVRAYDFSADGKKALKAQDASALSGLGQQLCYGTPSVDEVTQFTEPSDAMGAKVSMVSYKYHLKDVPGWAKDTKVQAAFPNLARDTGDSLTGQTEVVLMNDGWQDGRTRAH